MIWLRYYVATLDNPKVQRLPDPLFRAWINLLCIARKHGGRIPGNVDDLAFALRSTAAKVRLSLARLVAARLLEPDGDAWRPHDWAEHQYESDVSTARVKRHREKARNVSSAVSATPPESERESDTEAEQSRPEARVPRAGPQGDRLPSDWEPDPALVAWAEAELPGVDWRTQNAAFRDYWIAQPGAKGRKADWPATWRNWMRRALEYRGGSHVAQPHGPGPGQRLRAGIAAAFADLAAQPAPDRPEGARGQAEPDPGDLEAS
jgi:hypothetical protein